MSVTHGNCTWIALPFDISVHHTWYWKNVFAVVYGVVPPVWVFFCVLSMIITRRMTFIALTTLGLSMTIIQQILVKSIAQNRPLGTCCPLPCPQAMPSGHAVHDVGWILYLWFEIISNLYLFPMNRFPLWKKGIFMIIVGLIWAPGLPSRVYVHDHTIFEVVIGGIIGLVLSFLYILFIYFYVRPKGIDSLLSLSCSKRINITNDYYSSVAPAIEKERALSPRLIDRPDLEMGMSDHGTYPVSTDEKTDLRWNNV